MTEMDTSAGQSGVGESGSDTPPIADIPDTDRTAMQAERKALRRRRRHLIRKGVERRDPATGNKISAKDRRDRRKNELAAIRKAEQELKRALRAEGHEGEKARRFMFPDLAVPGLRKSGSAADPSSGPGMMESLRSLVPARWPFGHRGSGPSPSGPAWHQREFVREPAADQRTGGQSADTAAVDGPPSLIETDDRQLVKMPQYSPLRRAGSDDTEWVSNRVEIDLEMLRARGMVTNHIEHNQVSEEIRFIKRPLLMNAFGKSGAAVPNGHLIMVTSTRPGEGKTFCAINLAMSIAQERDLTVLLVDADVAMPSVQYELGLDLDRGLTDLIADDDLDVSDVLVRTNLDNLAIIPAGRMHHLPTELVASERMASIISDLAKRYSDRIVIFDSPPVLASSIPSVLSYYVGQTVFVVEAEKTAAQGIDSALSMIAECPRISLLLNKTQKASSSDKYGGYGYYRYGA